MVSNEELDEKFKVMMTARLGLFEAGEKELEATDTLKKAETKAVNDGMVTGSNEMLRKASLALITELESLNLAGAERMKRLAQYNFEVASMDVDLLKWKIRRDAVAAEVPDVI